jgi:aminobenzoyl-glutamate utilization protein B
MPNDHSAATRGWGPAALTPAKQTALDWIKAHAAWLSDRHTEVWNFHEPAWRDIDPPPGM